MDEFVIPKRRKKYTTVNKKEPISIDFHRAIRGKNLPLLTLDERWLTLFGPEDMTMRMKELQVKINELLKRQGKYVEELKGYKRYKSQLLQEIMQNMEVNDTPLGKLKAKKLEKNQKLVLEVNQQMEQSEEELSNIPYEIKATNEELLVETTKFCVDQLLSTGAELNQIQSEILELESNLKHLKRQEKQIQKTNREIYLYLNDMLGTPTMKQIDDQLELRSLD